MKNAPLKFKEAEDLVYTVNIYYKDTVRNVTLNSLRAAILISPKTFLTLVEERTFYLSVFWP